MAMRRLAEKAISLVEWQKGHSTVDEGSSRKAGRG